MWQKHSLSAIGGIAIPDIVIRRVLNSAEISWTDRAGKRRTDIRWIESVGSERLPWREVALVLQDTLRGTLEAIKAIATDLGFRVPEPTVVSFDLNDAALADPPPFRLAASGNWSVLTVEDRSLLNAVVAGARISREAASTLRHSPQPVDPSEPWSAGYRLADEYRELRGWTSTDTAPDFLHHASLLGVDVGEVTISNPRLHGLSLSGPSYRPTIRWNSKSERAGSKWSRQMLIAHELCHLVFDADKEQNFSILSDASTDWPTEARANAFAAELVMPREGVAQFLGSRQVTRKVLAEFMSKFGVGILAATWHLKNLGRIDEIERISLIRKQV